MKIYFVIPMLYFFLTCQSTSKNEPMIQPNKDINNATESYKIETYATFSWGNAEDQIVPIISKKGGNWAEESLNSQYEYFDNVYLKIGINKTVFILNNFTIHYTSPNNPNSKIPLQMGEQYQYSEVVDFVVNDKLEAFLLLTNGKLNLLVKFDRNGVLVWEKKGTFNPRLANFETLDGEFEHLFLDDLQAVYLCSYTNGSQMARIASENGAISLPTLLQAGTRLALASKFASTVQRPLIETNNQMEKLQLNSSIVNQSVNWLFGVDAKQNCFSYKDKLVKFSFGGEKLSELAFEGVFLSENKTILSSINKNMLLLSFPMGNSLKVEAIRFPSQLSNEKFDSIVLVKVDTVKKEYYCLVEKINTLSRKLIRFSADDLYEEIPLPNNLYEHATLPQHYSTWQVDNEGNVYIPILSPKGLKIMQLTF